MTKNEDLDLTPLDYPEDVLREAAERRHDIDVCVCGSEDLYSGYFDSEGFAVPLNPGDVEPVDVKYMTVCNSCGERID